MNARLSASPETRRPATLIGIVMLLDQCDKGGSNGWHYSDPVWEDSWGAKEIAQAGMPGITPFCAAVCKSAGTISALACNFRRLDEKSSMTIRAATCVQKSGSAAKSHGGYDRGNLASATAKNRAGKSPRTISLLQKPHADTA